jgi:hypothetical protein
MTVTVTNPDDNWDPETGEWFPQEYTFGDPEEETDSECLVG